MGSRFVQCLGLALSLVLLFTTKLVQSGNVKVFDVRAFGAVGNGKTDDKKAIMSAWNSACQNIGGGFVLIPKGTYKMGSVELVGPCKGQMVFQNQGNLVAPPYGAPSIDPGHWISFRYVNNLIINGGGQFDGQGRFAWAHNDCLHNPKCKQLPISMRLDYVKKAFVSNVNFVNSMNFHIVVFQSNDVKFDHIHITAPGDSPNTDGIHIGDSTDVKIMNSVISTGDDCISIGSNVTDVEVRSVHCGPGHGISIGSLGKYPGESGVSGIIVSDCIFSGTQNGLRIKTWGSTKSKPYEVYNITYEHITMDNVNNPIFIDQNYCPTHKGCPKESSKIQIRDVKFHNITGTSSSKVAVSFICSQNKPCENINLNTISLAHNGKDGPAISQCFYAVGQAKGAEQPKPCLKQ